MRRQIECYVCEGYGTLQDGRKCPNCKGTGRMLIECPKKTPEERRKEMEQFAENMKVMFDEDIIII